MKIRATARFTYVPQVLLATAAIVELVHDLVLRRTWPDIDYGWVLGFGVGLAALWLIAAVATALRQAWAWPLAMFAALTLMGHGSVLRTGGSWTGLIYLLLGGGALFLFAQHARAWGFRLDPVRRSSWER